MPNTVTWHRPEYRGRENELISLSDAARTAEVSKQAISQWRLRHTSFPTAVLTAARTTMIPAAEFNAWLATYRASRPGAGRGVPGTGPKKADRIRAIQTRIGRLEALAARQAAVLDATRHRIAAAQAQLKALSN